MTFSNRQFIAVACGLVLCISLPTVNAQLLLNRKPKEHYSTGLNGIRTSQSFDGGFIATEATGDTLRLFTFTSKSDLASKAISVPRVSGVLFDARSRCVYSIRVVGSYETIIEKRYFDTTNEGPTWLSPDGWSPFAITGNGSGVVAIAYEDDYDNRSPDFDWNIQRARIALLNTDTDNLDWHGIIDSEKDGMNLSEIALSAGGDRLAIAGWNNGIAVVDTRMKQKAWEIRPEKEVSTNAVIFSKDGKKIFSGGGAGTVFAFRSDNGKITKTFPTLTEGQRVGNQRIIDIATSNNGKWIAACTAPTGITVVWEIESGKEIYRCKHGSPPWLVSFSPDDSMIATMSSGSIRLWQLDSINGEKERDKQVKRSESQASIPDQ